MASLLEQIREPPNLRPTETIERNSFFPSCSSTFGLVQAPTVHDSESVLQSKVGKLAKLVQQANSVIALTGAGISTSSGIPDYRSPSGTHHSSFFDFEMVKQAHPTIAHMVLASMHDCGKLSTVITGNHDNLHQKAGLQEESVVELHGNFFIEKCSVCGHIYQRSDVVRPPIYGHLTNNKCSWLDCKGELENNIVKFGEEVPPDVLKKAISLSQAADLCIVLGTSMLVKPMNHFPLCAKNFVIVNLQEGPMDNDAWLVIHGTCDEVMALLADKLGIKYTLPPPSSKVMELPAWAVRAANGGGEESIEEAPWE